MLETGDNDNAVGPGGEVSRFQIQPALWPGGDSHGPEGCLVAAQAIMRPRLQRFQESHKRAATDLNFTFCGNAPAKINLPPAAVLNAHEGYKSCPKQSSPQTTNSNHQTNRGALNLVDQFVNFTYSRWSVPGKIRAHPVLPEAADQSGLLINRERLADGLGERARGVFADLIPFADAASSVKSTTLSSRPPVARTIGIVP